ncbi:hypothetical protein, partial [Mesorhizobium sp. P5_C1]
TKTILDKSNLVGCHRRAPLVLVWVSLDHAPGVFRMHVACRAYVFQLCLNLASGCVRLFSNSFPAPQCSAAPPLNAT